MKTNARARFFYNYLFIPKGITGSHSVVCDGEDEFYRLLDQWNRSAPKEWKYWATSDLPILIPKSEHNDYTRCWPGAQLVYLPNRCNK